MGGIAPLIAAVTPIEKATKMTSIGTRSNYTVENANIQDLPFIYQLFEQAIAFQKANNYIGWQDYDKAFLKS